MSGRINAHQVSCTFAERDVRGWDGTKALLPLAQQAGARVSDDAVRRLSLKVPTNGFTALEITAPGQPEGPHCLSNVIKTRRFT